MTRATSTAAPPGHSNRNTAVLVVFTALTNLADGVTKVVLPLMATRLTDSPAQVAGVALTLTLPWLLVALHVGVLVDRFDRRLLLWLADGARMLVVTALLVLALREAVTVPALYVAGLVLGVAEVVALTSAATLVPSLVAPAGRERANAWVAGAETACNEFCGPFVGGLLVAAGAGVALGWTGVGYLIGTLILLLLVGRFKPASDGPRPAGTVNQRIAEGVRFLWRQRLLRLMALALTVLSACWGAWLALMPLVATTLMDLDTREYGLLLSALGAGGLVGAVTVTSVNRLLGRRWSMFADLIGTAAMVAAPVLSTSLWVVAGGAFLGGMGGILWTVNSRTLSQRLVPDVMLGRYNAAARLFSWGAMPLGAGLVGVLAEWFGIRTAFAVFALATLVIIVPFLRTVTPRTLAEATGQGAGPQAPPSAVSEGVPAPARD
ncbi:MFS family permease [Streptomyces sp. PvR006]|uniref:MFS transporter n=1 Tax=Streptomyces sp. PvR006 TaxID=2817860 RepID=UPI001AE26849|nr:MFS transporter [Streptomyces sp. PvR006]MBP2586912.1 MFS family permease [Streptomyces sp. PvR006]